MTCVKQRANCNFFEVWFFVIVDKHYNLEFKIEVWFLVLAGINYDFCLCEKVKFRINCEPASQLSDMLFIHSQEIAYRRNSSAESGREETALPGVWCSLLDWLWRDFSFAKLESQDHWLRSLIFTWLWSFGQCLWDETKHIFSGCRWHVLFHWNPQDSQASQ